MTQAEARNAVKHIKRKLDAIVKKCDQYVANNNIPVLDFFADVQDLALDVQELDLNMSITKQATPNCRPATISELSALCASSNVVMFPAA